MDISTNDARRSELEEVAHTIKLWAEDDRMLALLAGDDPVRGFEIASNGLLGIIWARIAAIQAMQVDAIGEQ